MYLIPSLCDVFFDFSVNSESSLLLGTDTHSHMSNTQKEDTNRNRFILTQQTKDRRHMEHEVENSNVDFFLVKLLQGGSAFVSFLM